MKSMEITETTTNELILRIEERYGKMSKGQRRLADYVRQNYDKAVFLTAAKLGETVGVSESTVVRFAIQLGYKGYPGFQKALEELVRNRLKLHPAHGSDLRQDHAERDPGDGPPVRYRQDQNRPWR